MGEWWNTREWTEGEGVVPEGEGVVPEGEGVVRVVEIH